MRKPLILTAAFLLAASAPALAQSQQAPPPPQTVPNSTGPAGQGAPPQQGAQPQQGHRRMIMMQALQQMNLSDSQRSQIKSLVSSFRQQNASVTDPATRQANVKQLRSQIMAVLSPDQQTQLQSNIKMLRQHRAQQMQQQGQGQGQNGPPPSGAPNGPPPNSAQ